MAATTPAATSATVPATVALPGDLVNVPVGGPAAERYPGSIDPTAYVDKGPVYPLTGPVGGPWVLPTFGAAEPNVSSGGGVEDYAWTTGTDGPMAVWDSSAGEPFAPSRAVLPCLHGEDTGQTFISSYSVPSEIGLLKRQTITGQTYNREFAFDAVTGQWVPSPNGRIDFDQRQTWDPDPLQGGGYAPSDPGYAERPIYNNVAYMATPVTSVDTPYGVSGNLPDRSQFAYTASAYEAPPDPAVSQAAAPAASTAGGWILS